MKNVLMSLVTVIAAWLPCFGQNQMFDNPDNQVHFGVRLGLDINSLRGPEERYGTHAGFNVTGIYNLPLWKNLYFEPGLGVFYDTATLNAVKDTEGTMILSRGSVRNLGFRVPFNFGYRIDATDDVSLHIFTGPQVNYNLKFATYYGGVKASNQPEADFNRLDFQWNVGLGVDYGCYYAYLQGGLGLTRLIQEKKHVYNDFQIIFPGAKRNLFTIGVGYNF